MTRPIKSEDAVINYTVEAEQGALEIPEEHLGQIEGDVVLPDPEKDYEEEYFVGAGRSPADKFEGQTAYTGGTLPIKPVDGRPLALLLGEEEFTDGTEENTHVLTLAEQGPPVSMSLGVDYKGHDFTRVFEGAVAGSGELTVNDDDELITEVDVDALGVDTETEFTGNDNVPERSVWSFKTVSQNLQMFGKTFARLQEFSLEIDQGTTIEWYVTSETEGSEPFEILYGRPTIELNATITVTDGDIYEYLVDEDATFSTSIEFTKDDASLEIELSECDIRSAPHGVPEEGSVDSDVEVAAEDITITVEDSESTGPYLE